MTRWVGLLCCTSMLAIATPALAGPATPSIGGTLSTPLPVAASPVIGTLQPVSGDVSALYGRINPFYGDVESSYGRINPFYGRINPFYGRINPFFGDVTGFWGRINPFTQVTDTSVTSFYGKDFDAFWGSSNPYKGSTGATYGRIATFWGDSSAAWNEILPQWNSATTLEDADAVATTLQTQLVAPTAAFWKPLVARAAKSNASAEALIRARFAEVGITFRSDGTIDRSSLLGSSPSDRAMLFLNLYDDLMDYAGTGHVDWWMARTGWTPALAETQGKAPIGGVTPTIGMIDFAVTPSGSGGKSGAAGTHLSKQVVQYGSTVFADGHGAAVGSLIIGAVDGSGVLGVLPSGAGKVVVYDPYDETGTTNWTDVGKGIATLTSAIFSGKVAPLGVLNASLGVPGWTLHPGWNDALKSAGASGHNLVVAAGNDGIAQTENVPWDFAANPTLLIVGSVGVDGTISNFSNRPGEACLLRVGVTSCQEADKLKYRFLVAPGELILVSDGLGGHMRQSGTSLAAPLVSGAIALLQNRWPWLANYPEETASIILGSATPRGDQPGADATYGVGELNIAASQAPLRYDNLVYYQVTNNRPSLIPLSLSRVVAQIRGGTQQAFDASGLAFTALERVGATYRDFQIPLASRLVGQSVLTMAGGQAYQSFLSAALRGQAERFTLGAAPGTTGTPVYGFAAQAPAVSRIGGATLRVAVTPVELGNAYRITSNRYETHAALVTDTAALQFGFGQGAAALGGSAGFGYRSDYDVGRGGANPLLGLASGGGYIAAQTAVTPCLTLMLGTTGRDTRRNLGALGMDRMGAGSWINRYAADAQTVAVAYRVGGGLTTRISYTRLDEKAALLGSQSVDRADLLGGATTDGATAGFDLALGRGLTLSGTGTVARSRAAGGQISTRDLTSASAALALTKAGLLARSDELRLTVASPMHSVAGHVSYSSFGVVDRLTGQLGVVTSTAAAGQRMPLAGQASYGMQVAGGRGEFSLLGRVDHGSGLGLTEGMLGYTAGAQFRLAIGGGR